ncbi:dysbindin isoform X2 [Physeter macrocephalus]|uniref:Dysbindin isoform X2 n=1 Tax=Physeter macrocephalus TaxID=9755 RepID=A0A9W2W878_PHYMC|nr:dysbindin isoform X2 [Physeter catodon]
MMLETLRERLLSVQQDFTSGLKTLSDKSREAKVKNKPRTVAYLPKCSAGLELLSRYEDTWAALHRRAQECASAGELVDSEVVVLSAHWEKKQASLIELQQQLRQLPGLKADLETLTASLTELDAEHTQKVLDMEQTQQMKLRERQKFFEEAFQQDMEQYLSTGSLQTAERREPMGSLSSMEVNVDMLEQMDLVDISDQEALDVFLNSGGEGNTVLSPVSGPEASPGQDAVTLQVPNASRSRATRPSSSSPCTDPTAQDPSEGGESPVVQSDEEGVEVDTALATFHSDDSDS